MPITAAAPDLEGQPRIVLAQQKAPDSDDRVVVPVAPSGYYSSVPSSESDCAANGPGPVVVDRDAPIHVPDAVLPVDVAAASSYLVVVAAANAHTANKSQLFVLERDREPRPFACNPGRGIHVENAQLTSVALVGAAPHVLALSREPAALLTIDARTGTELGRVTLATDSREDTGHAVFHSNSGAGVACASCHPDGRDDGHAWRSQQLGPRRTPSLLGTLANTAPYHWNGEAKDMAGLVQMTFESRMRGPQLGGDRIDAMDAWLRALKAMPSARSTDAAAVRGKTLFEGAAQCATCHAGTMRTNNATVDVRTGGSFQVPSLIGVAWRAPHLHDGSVPSVKALLERSHGGASLNAQQVLDLDSYVGTL